MTLTIKLPPEIEQKLRACAAANGVDMADYALKAIEEKLQGASPSVDERLAPLRQEFRASGMSDDELHELLKQARDEVRREKREQQSP
jgi:hypothetical protein